MEPTRELKTSLSLIKIPIWWPKTEKHSKNVKIKLFSLITYENTNSLAIYTKG